MEEPTAREDLIAHLRDIRVQFLKAIEGLDEGQMTEPTIDGWSVKDHLNHMAYWHELRASEIARISAGRQHAWPREIDFEPLNEMIQSARSHLTLDQALWEYETAVEKAIEALGQANERGLTGSHYGEVGLKTTHDLAHADFIRAWRERRGI